MYSDSCTATKVLIIVSNNSVLNLDKEMMVTSFICHVLSPTRIILVHFVGILWCDIDHVVVSSS